MGSNKKYRCVDVLFGSFSPIRHWKLVEFNKKPTKTAVFWNMSFNGHRDLVNDLNGRSWRVESFESFGSLARFATGQIRPTMPNTAVFERWACVGKSLWTEGHRDLVQMPCLGVLMYILAEFGQNAQIVWLFFFQNSTLYETFNSQYPFEFWVVGAFLCFPNASLLNIKCQTQCNKRHML